MLLLLSQASRVRSRKPVYFIRRYYKVSHLCGGVIVYVIFWRKTKHTKRLDDRRLGDPVRWFLMKKEEDCHEENLISSKNWDKTLF